MPFPQGIPTGMRENVAPCRGSGGCSDLLTAGRYLRLFRSISWNEDFVKHFLYQTQTS
jgi:hypothetical protein